MDGKGCISSSHSVCVVGGQNLKQDLEGQMKRIASFLEIDIDEAALKKAADKCTFAHMKVPTSTHTYHAHVT